MKEAYIIDGIRTPIGKFTGTLGSIRTDDLGALVIREVVKRNPTIPKEAYDDVIKAREDQERLINEAQAYANGIIPEARGAAQRILEDANAYKEKVIVEARGEAKRFEQLLVEYEKAPVVTRERLYLDAMQMVMENSSKVLVDVEGGNNIMYLPLDKILEKQRGSVEPARSEASSTNSRPTQSSSNIPNGNSSRNNTNDTSVRTSDRFNDGRG